MCSEVVITYRNFLVGLTPYGMFIHRAQRYFEPRNILSLLLTLPFLLKDHGHNDYSTLCCLGIWALCSELGI
jgi:hypothetical protein